MFEHRSAIVGAIVMIVALTILGVINTTDQTVLILAFGGQTIIMLAGYLKVDKIGHEMNGMKDQLVSAAKKEGIMQEQIKTLDDNARPPQVPDLFQSPPKAPPIPPRIW